jgi:hypothetical protein
MMKKIIGLITILAVMIGCIATQPMMPISDVNEFQNLTQEVLFDRVVEWGAMEFKSANHAIQLKDKENGVIVFKGSSQLNRGGNGIIIPVVMMPVTFTLTVRIKDAKIKTEFTDAIVMNGEYRSIPMSPIAGSETNKVKEIFSNIRSSLLIFLENYEKKNNW